MKRNLSGAVNRAERRDRAFGRYHDTHTPLALPEDPAKKDLYGRTEFERILMGVGNEPVRNRDPQGPAEVLPYTYVARFATQVCNRCRVKSHPFLGIYLKATAGEAVRYTPAQLVPALDTNIDMEVDPTGALIPFCPNCRQP